MLLTLWRMFPLFMHNVDDTASGKEKYYNEKRSITCSSVRKTVENNVFN
jgi:hypothetical protein